MKNLLITSILAELAALVAAGMGYAGDVTWGVAMIAVWATAYATVAPTLKAAPVAVAAVTAPVLKAAPVASAPAVASPIEYVITHENFDRFYFDELDLTVCHLAVVWGEIEYFELPMYEGERRWYCDKPFAKRHFPVKRSQALALVTESVMEKIIKEENSKSWLDKKAEEFEKEVRNGLKTAKLQTLRHWEGRIGFFMWHHMANLETVTKMAILNIDLHCEIDIRKLYRKAI